MTCIVAYKGKNSLFIGGDRQGSAGHYISDRKKAKVFKKDFKREIALDQDNSLLRTDKMVMGYTTSFRMGDILEHIFEPPNLPTNMDEEKYMVKLFVPALIKCFADNQWLTKINEVSRGGVFIVGFNRRLFIIEGDFQVSEEESNYIAVGCGADLAKGAFSAIEEIDPPLTIEERIKIALKASAKHSAYVGDAYDVIGID